MNELAEHLRTLSAANLNNRYQTALREYSQAWIFAHPQLEAWRELLNALRVEVERRERLTPGARAAEEWFSN